MTNLDAVSDKVVRDAVDAYLDGRLAPELSGDRTGETAFETKNSRYRLVDGIVIAAPDDSLIGSELVGWLIESTRRSVVESAWQPGSRAVLVDRHRGRNIIVTSTTRLLHVEERADSGRRTPAPEAPLPAFEAPAELFTMEGARRYPASEETVAAPRPSQTPQVESTPSAAAVQRRAAAIHLPPRPIAAPPSPWPVHPPAPPPYTPPAPFAQVNSEPQEPGDGIPWELTSGEFEMEEPEAADLPPHDAARLAPSAWAAPAGRVELAEPAEPAEASFDAPILLVRPGIGAPPRGTSGGMGVPPSPQVPRPRR